MPSPFPYFASSHSFVFMKCPQSNYTLLDCLITLQPSTYRSVLLSQWAWMNTLQNKMPLLVHLFYTFDPLLSGRSPRQEHHAIRPLLCHDIDHLLCEDLPPLFRVRVRFVFPNCEASVQHQDTAVCPRGQQTAPSRRLLEVWVVLLERFIYVLERGWSGRGWADREAKPVGLIGVVVGVLACDDSLDSVEGRVSRPDPLR